MQRIAVLSLTKSCTLSWLKPDTRFLTLGNFIQQEGGKIGSKISHTIFQQFDFEKKKKKLNKLAVGQKYHHSDFYECLKFESGFVF